MLNEAPVDQPERPQLSEQEMLAVVDELAERLDRRRRIEMAGLVAALVVVITGLVAALWAIGTWGQDGHLAWLLFIPLAAAGIVLKISGARAKRAMRQGLSPDQ